MTSRPVISIETITAELDARAEALARELLPLGRREGGEWIDAHRADGGLGDSMRVAVAGAKRGRWAHFGGGGWRGKSPPKGDALDLVGYVLDLGPGDAVKWAKAWLGLDQADRAALERRRRAAEAASRKAASAEAEKTARKRRSIKALFLAAQPALRGTPAELYLRGRGLDLARLGRQPGALRYHPSAWCAEDAAAGKAEPYRPALVAAISDAAGEMVAVHRTYLLALTCDHCGGRGGGVRAGCATYGDCPACAGSGRAWTKPPLRDPKKSWGRYAGAAIRLWRGANGVRWSDWYAGKGPVMPSRVKVGADPDPPVVITEGIEDGLSVALALPEARVLVAVSLANMANVPLPPVETGLALDPVIAADADAPGSPAAKSLDAAVVALHAAGRRPRLARAPEGAKDFNEVLAGASRPGAAAPDAALPRSNRKG